MMECGALCDKMAVRCAWKLAQSSPHINYLELPAAFLCYETLLSDSDGPITPVHSAQLSSTRGGCLRGGVKTVTLSHFNALLLIFWCFFRSWWITASLVSWLTFHSFAICFINGLCCLIHYKSSIYSCIKALPILIYHFLFWQGHKLHRPWFLFPGGEDQGAARLRLSEQWLSKWGMTVLTDVYAGGASYSVSQVICLKVYNRIELSLSDHAGSEAQHLELLHYMWCDISYDSLKNTATVSDITLYSIACHGDY